ncbi:hypothetical protein [Mycetocola zhadangensis]|uniref:hypothetical protein n=1 Tax=Mycetocola zhadangensis TaxID=1164595 RepID=UPI0011C398DA|nr:hypothetical protein [Mycetocola zhadangensis]
MTYRFLYELSHDEALRYRDEFEAQHSAKLRELRQVIERSGGDTGPMDGSFESLVPLWKWAKLRLDAGLPELPPTSRSLATRFQRQDEEANGPVSYLGELLEHYVFDVVAHLRPMRGWRCTSRSRRL